ncbi:MAG: class I SAM-dependent methyltransferase [Betaproteobacteria bacterium]
MDVEKIYARWSYEDMIDRFARRSSWLQLFHSEQKILKRLNCGFESVLDVGCALGSMSNVFEAIWPNIQYTGLDVSAEMINRAKKSFPQHRFITTNVLDYRGTGINDFVFATGVCQHEPQFKEAIVKLIELAGKYVTFDCKIIHGHSSVIDVDKSYCNHDDRLFYILVEYKDLLNILKAATNIKSIYLYGYYAKVSEKVVVPNTIDKTKISVCQVLIEKGDSGPAKWEFDLPDEFSETTTKFFNAN